MRLMFGKAAAFLPFALILNGCGSNEDSGSRWAGKTYLLDIPEINWVKPNQDVGRELAPFVPQFLISVTGSGSNLVATVATAENGFQNPCNETQQVAFSESDYPESQFVLSQFPMTFQEVNTYVTPNVTVTQKSVIHDMTLVNVLPGDSSTKQGTFTVTADIAELAPLFVKPIVPQPPTPDGVCQTIASTSTATCTACAFNGSSYCLTLGAVMLVATLSSAAVKQVSLGDIAASCP
jgi:hypothetical protein